MIELAADPWTQNLLIFGGMLFAFGLLGFLTRRSMILLFLSLELMLAGVSTNLLAFGRYHGNLQGQVFTIMILTVAACEAAIALAMVTSLYRHRATLDIRAWSRLSERTGPAEVESAEPLPGEHEEFPVLSTAGLDPASRLVPARGAPGWNRSSSMEEDPAPTEFGNRV